MTYLTTIINGEIVRIPNTFQNNKNIPSAQSNTSNNLIKSQEVNNSKLINLTNEEKSLPESDTIIDVYGKISRFKNILIFNNQKNNKNYKIDILTCINPKNNFKSCSFILNLSNNLVRFNKDSVLDMQSYKSIISYGKLKSSECKTIIKNIW